MFGDFGDVRRCKPFSWESAPVRLIPELATDHGDALNLSLDIFPKQRLDADQRHGHRRERLGQLGTLDAFGERSGHSRRPVFDIPGELHQVCRGCAGGCATLLCLAAGTRQRDCQVILDAYGALDVAAVCLTKWDETVAPGEALASVVERGLPLSHLCIGQEVPADIVVADAVQIASAAFDCETAGASA